MAGIQLGRRGLVTGVVAVLVGVTLAADATPVDTAGATIVSRAEQWYRHGPTYSQDRCYQTGVGYRDADWGGVLGGCHQPYYRTDCSGFVSMVWGLPYSYATPRAGLATDLSSVSVVIGKDELRAGDALLAYGEHVRLFERWTDSGRTRYLAYDFGSTPVKHQEYRWGAVDDRDYLPIRHRPR